MKKKIIIIGAGVSGLAVGSYLQMNGYETEIFEQHNMPGGLCTSFKRKGYTFDTCIHWLMGSGPSKNLYEVWKELHAVQGKRFIEWDTFMVIRTDSGEKLTLFTDPDKLETEMLRLGPDDGKLIRIFCRGIKKLSVLDFPAAAEKMGFLKNIRMLLRSIFLMPAFMKLSSTDMFRFIDTMKSPVLKDALRKMIGGLDISFFPIIAPIMMLGFMYRKSAGYPIGGSLEFAKSIEKRYIGLGGNINYSNRVDTIIVRNDTAVGIKTGGKEYTADKVISCADGHATLFDMLGGKYISKKIRTAYETYPLYSSLLYVSIGIARQMKDVPHSLVFPLKKEIIAENGALKLNSLYIRIFNFDTTLAPEGKTGIIVMINTHNYDYWSDLKKKDPEKYNAEKERLGRDVVEAIDAELGDITSRVEVVDVATPYTWNRYTGNWKGSYEGFLPTRKTMMKSLGFTVPGLKNFYMHGQWVAIGGGLPPAATNGRALAKLICKKDGIKFNVVE
jgi:phytoene dehydrogenase-like protein